MQLALSKYIRYLYIITLWDSLLEWLIDLNYFCFKAIQ
jgi:hypothetical protein